MLWLQIKPPLCTAPEPCAAHKNRALPMPQQQACCLLIEVSSHVTMAWQKERHSSGQASCAC